MVGNDVVDLSDPETLRDARHSRFDRRVFAPVELEALSSSPDRERMRWILWSAKESAYKAARRLRSDTVFSPTRFVVHLDRSLRGFVSHGRQLWPVRIGLTGACVHAVVSRWRGGDDTICGTRRLERPAEDDPSDRVRELALAVIASRLQLSRARLRIVRTDRIPRLLVGDRTLAAQLSLSHHGSYVGFACRFDAAPERAH